MLHLVLLKVFNFIFYIVDFIVRENHCFYNSPRNSLRYITATSWLTWVEINIVFFRIRNFLGWTCNSVFIQYLILIDWILLTFYFILFWIFKKIFQSLLFFTKWNRFLSAHWSAIFKIYCLFTFQRNSLIQRFQLSDFSLIRSVNLK